MSIERRYFHSRELRAGGTSSKPQISGYASVFNRYTTIQTKEGSFRECIKPGAFSRALKSNSLDCVCLFNHNDNFVLGRSTAGTLRLREDDHGLFYACDLPDTQIARDLRESIKRRDINGCSFGFTMRSKDDEDWYEDEERGVRVIKRDIRAVDELIDVSPVTQPAYDDTEVDARSLLVTDELRSRVEASRSRMAHAQHIRKALRGELESFEDKIKQQAAIRRRRQNLLSEIL